MKKITKTVLALLGAIMLFSGCKEGTPVVALAPMTGAWQCIGVSGGVLGGVLTTPALENKALNLLSVVYVGSAGIGGVYARTGSGDITADVTGITGLLSGGNEDVDSSWKNYLSTGTFTYTGNDTEGVIVMTSKDGLMQEYKYSIFSEKDVIKMELRESKNPSGLSDAVSTVTAVIGSLFGGTSPSLLEIVYTYQKVQVADIINQANKKEE